MPRTALLREQATILRSLAESFDIPRLREDLLSLAARCEELANSIDENPPVAAETP